MRHIWISNTAKEFKKRMAMRFDPLGLTNEKADTQLIRKAKYAESYSAFLDAWQHSERICEHWIEEVRKRNGGALNSEDLKSEEWKRRIRAVYPYMPDDLLNRLVRDPRSPFFVKDIDDYSRTRSGIAAVHTARYCKLPEDRSYMTHRRYYREGQAIQAVMKNEHSDDSDLGE
jgi:hypothetical protein